MWYEMRSQTQHRVYWREAGKKKYEAFATEAEARAFLKHCRTHGVSVVLAAMASPQETAPASTPAPTAPTEVPRLAGSLRAPELTGITLKWLATHYVTNTTEANEVTKDGYLRDIERFILPYFGDIDIALVQTHSLPLADGGEWPFPTVVAWKQKLAGMPKANDPGATIADKTRRNIEALLAQIFSSAVDFAPAPLLQRNPCAGLTLAKVEDLECVFLSRTQARFLLEQLDPRSQRLVRFLLGTGVRWGEAKALQVKDFHAGDGTDLDPAYIHVHKTWKRLTKRKTTSAPDAKGYEWGRGRTKTRAGRRRITLPPILRETLLEACGEREPEAPLFVGAQGGMIHAGNFTNRVLKPALARAQSALEAERAAATPAQRVDLPKEMPPVRPHGFRHSHAAWLLSAGRPVLEVQRRLGHADPATTTRIYGHLTPEVGGETVAVIDAHLNELMTVGVGSVVSAAEDSTVDDVDAIDATLPFVSDDDDEELAA